MKRKIKRLRKRKTTTDELSIIKKNLKTELRQAKETFFNETLTSFLQDSPRKFWLFFQSKGERIEQILDGTEVIEEEGEISDRFNRYFQSVFIKSQDDTEEYQLPLPLTSMAEEICITHEGIFNQLLLLDTKKSAGPDGIPTVFLRRYAEWLSYYLTVLFRKSLNYSSLPQDWRSAVVVPIFKSGNRMLVNNYRPVSLTSVCI